MMTSRNAATQSRRAVMTHERNDFHPTGPDCRKDLCDGIVMDFGTSCKGGCGEDDEFVRTLQPGGRTDVRLHERVTNCGDATAMSGQGLRDMKKQANKTMRASGVDAKQAAPGGGWMWGVGIAALAVAIGFSMMLVTRHLRGIELPGCGAGSACDEAAKSVWGSVPGLGVSTASVGLTFFVAMLVWWVIARGVGTWLKRLALVGALASAVFVGVMLTHGWVCVYCLGAHLANFVFVGSAWMLGRQYRFADGLRGPVMAIGTGALMFGSLASWESKVRVEQAAKAKAEAAKSVEAMKQASKEPAKAAENVASATSGTSVTEEKPVAPAASEKPFEGRYRMGNEEAAIRIVFLTDYQCPDCKIMESQLKRVMGMGLDVAVSSKHFPLSKTCNPNMPTDMHPDACFGAYAAEAAGELGGVSAFWQMHEWLFARDGKFTPADVVAFGNSIGVDGVKLRTLMDSALIQQRVKDDISEGEKLGLRNTPMIFVNGVELRGWMAPDSLVNAVQQLAASNPPKRSARADKPPLAEARVMEIFASEPVVVVPTQLQRFSLGPADAKHRVVVVGDYQEPATAEVDGVIRGLIGSGASVRYSYAHFPVNQTCNPEMTFTRYEASCNAAKLVEAAGVAGGEKAFWAAHAWAFANRATPANLSAANLATAISASTGVSAEILQQAMAGPDGAAMIAADAKAAKGLGLTGLPAIYVDGKLVREWKVSGKSVLAEMLASE
jgi:protein-disulfide isomerase/uncharacterized membrane protein